MFKIYGIVAGILAVLAIVFYVYFSYTQSKIDGLVNELAVLTTVNASNTQTIENLQASIELANNIRDALNDQIAIIRNDNALLERRLAEHDLAYLANARPGLIANITTNATNDAFRCFDLLSGARLTPTEENAPNENTFNSECPWLFNSR